MKWAGLSTRKKSIKSRTNIDKMNVTQLNEAARSADLTLGSVAAYVIATVPSMSPVRQRAISKAVSHRHHSTAGRRLSDGRRHPTIML
jgi:hypothetical protein